jgi:hypothetical protein
MVPGLDAPELIGSLLAFTFTILILVYTFGDNPLFRLVIHIFIGVAAGYAAGVAIHMVVVPHLINPLITFIDGVPQVPLTDVVLRLVLIILLATKISPRTAVVGNSATAFLVGVGAAVAVGGAVQGTIFPQVASSTSFFEADTFWQAFNNGRLIEVLGLLAKGLMILIGTVSTLVYFHFTARSLPNQPTQQNQIVKAIGWVGQTFISITFGVIFANVYITALTALIERLYFITDFVFMFLRG